MDSRKRQKVLNWAASRSIEQLECRVGRHWKPNLHDLGKDPHVVLEPDRISGGRKIVLYCMRDCGTHWESVVMKVTGVVAESGPPVYPKDYQFTEEDGKDYSGPMDLESKNLIRALLIDLAFSKKPVSRAKNGVVTPIFKQTAGGS